MALKARVAFCPGDNDSGAPRVQVRFWPAIVGLPDGRPPAPLVDAATYVKPDGSAADKALTVSACEFDAGFATVTVYDTVPPDATLEGVEFSAIVGATPHALMAVPTSATCRPVTEGLPNQFSALPGACTGECAGKVACWPAFQALPM